MVSFQLATLGFGEAIPCWEVIPCFFFGQQNLPSLKFDFPSFSSVFLGVCVWFKWNPDFDDFNRPSFAQIFASKTWFWWMKSLHTPTCHFHVTTITNDKMNNNLYDKNNEHIIIFFIIRLQSLFQNYFEHQKKPRIFSLQQLKKACVFFLFFLLDTFLLAVFLVENTKKTTSNPHQNNASKRGWRLPWTTWRTFASDLFFI